MNTLANLIKIVSPKSEESKIDSFVSIFEDNFKMIVNDFVLTNNAYDLLNSNIINSMNLFLGKDNFNKLNLNLTTEEYSLFGKCATFYYFIKEVNNDSENDKYSFFSPSMNKDSLLEQRLNSNNACTTVKSENVASACYLALLEMLLLFNRKGKKIFLKDFKILHSKLYVTFFNSPKADNSRLLEKLGELLNILLDGGYITLEDLALYNLVNVSALSVLDSKVYTGTTDYLYTRNVDLNSNSSNEDYCNSRFILKGKPSGRMLSSNPALYTWFFLKDKYHFNLVAMLFSNATNILNVYKDELNNNETVKFLVNTTAKVTMTKFVEAITGYSSVEELKEVFPLFFEYAEKRSVNIYGCNNSLNRNQVSRTNIFGYGKSNYGACDALGAFYGEPSTKNYGVLPYSYDTICAEHLQTERTTVPYALTPISLPMGVSNNIAFELLDTNAVKAESEAIQEVYTAYFDKDSELSKKYDKYFREIVVDYCNKYAEHKNTLASGGSVNLNMGLEFLKTEKLHTKKLFRPTFLESCLLRNWDLNVTNYLNDKSQPAFSPYNELNKSIVYNDVSLVKPYLDKYASKDKGWKAPTYSPSNLSLIKGDGNKYIDIVTAMVEEHNEDFYLARNDERFNLVTAKKYDILSRGTLFPMESKLNSTGGTKNLYNPKFLIILEAIPTYLKMKGVEEWREFSSLLHNNSEISQNRNNVSMFLEAFAIIKERYSEDIYNGLEGFRKSIFKMIALEFFYTIAFNVNIDNLKFADSILLGYSFVRNSGYREANIKAIVAYNNDKEGLAQKRKYYTDRIVEARFGASYLHMETSGRVSATQNTLDLAQYRRFILLTQYVENVEEMLSADFVDTAYEHDLPNNIAKQNLQKSFSEDIIKTIVAEDKAYIESTDDFYADVYHPAVINTTLNYIEEIFSVFKDREFTRHLIETFYENASKSRLSELNLETIKDIIGSAYTSKNENLSFIRNEALTRMTVSLSQTPDLSLADRFDLAANIFIHLGCNVANLTRASKELLNRQYIL